MKFNLEKKNSIKKYIMEKISGGTESVSKYVSDELGISPNTVHNYLTELLEDGIIAKSKRGEYHLVSSRKEYTLKRSEGELESDSAPYDEFLNPIIKECADNVKHIWMYSLSEMVNNVIDHSGAEVLTLTIVKDYLKTKVILNDNGIGIFEKIKKYFGYADLDEAICELCKGKLTTDKENHSGEGIFFTSKMMDDFVISSGGKSFSTTKYDNDEIKNYDQNCSGTVVSMTLSNFTNKTTAEVFNAYSDIDGGFFKTKIPLKNIFESSPVSRSQAKRICNRLEQFSEVIIDFDEIKWMGQGFAHQIFAVFAKSHPDIKLKPINMCDDVEKMYNHVIKTV